MAICGPKDDAISSNADGSDKDNQAAVALIGWEHYRELHMLEKPHYLSRIQSEVHILRVCCHNLQPQNSVPATLVLEPSKLQEGFGLTRRSLDSESSFDTTPAMMTLLSISAGKISVQLQAMTPDTFTTKSGIKLLFMAYLNFSIIHSPNYATSFLSKVYEPPNGKPGYASTRCTKSVIPELIKVSDTKIIQCIKA
ncbi:hypothetical protein BCON_0204g00060 [Botryotinia convoluta]|uniref:Uncharacterized protein n=1 Tax=Botryotinia convoluta TaxID=54673 RepID=A0A4Z1HLF8_9HELO|nr:hypothetical protein BCON_0204g00060 [Botryotinia convoluta]